MEETSHRHRSRQNTCTHKINNKKLKCYLVLYRKYLPINLNTKKIGMCISLIGKEVHQLCNCLSLRCHSVADLMLVCVPDFCVEKVPQQGWPAATMFVLTVGRVFWTLHHYTCTCSLPPCISFLSHIPSSKHVSLWCSISCLIICSPTLFSAQEKWQPLRDCGLIWVS